MAVVQSAYRLYAINDFRLPFNPHAVTSVENVPSTSGGHRASFPLLSIIFAIIHQGVKFFCIDCGTEMEAMSAEGC